MAADTLARLEATVAARRGGAPDTSYVAKLLAGGAPLAARKLGEEAVEVVIAALAEPDKLVSESADLLFHLMVLLAERGVPFADVLAELDRREGVSGIAEKAARGA
ncbi:phosphoribosyl-ATP diphosphatase [Croceibacterium ferulae]|uniref:phosphoribosyl-ATP diphosphatase n=1 Tax=Croceibacterium ferulae TaxID=1854641 RepID=UPI000EB4F6F9|nr:phosphoribosyl-ATP diphosphatase [Croceibacterium ferulae]